MQPLAPRDAGLPPAPRLTRSRWASSACLRQDLVLASWHRCGTQHRQGVHGDDRFPKAKTAGHCHVDDTAARPRKARIVLLIRRSPVNPFDHVSCHGLVPPTCPQRSPAPHPRRFTLELVGGELFFVHRPTARIPDRSGQTRGVNGTFTSFDWAEKIALSTGLPHDSACLCTRCPHVVHRPCLRRQGAHVRVSGSTYKHVVLPPFRRERR